MKKYDQIVEGLLKSAWNAAGTGINTISNIASVAKKVATDPSIKNFTDLFSKIKSKLTLVNHDSALLHSANTWSVIKNPGTAVSLANDYTKLWKYTPNSVIIDSDGDLSGVVGEVINYKKSNLLNNFIEHIKNNPQKYNINIDNIIKETQVNNRFWVVLSPKGSNTVQNKQQSTTPAPATPAPATPAPTTPAPTTPAPAQSAQSTIYASYDQKIQNYYSLLKEQDQDMVAKKTQNAIDYDTFFVYAEKSGFNTGNIGKFIIKPSGQKPPKEYGEVENLKDMGAAGLVLCGNKTLYPKWYFLNDFEQFEKEEDDKNKAPEKSNLTMNRVTRNNQTQNP